jgi:hypothetical protein
MDTHDTEIDPGLKEILHAAIHRTGRMPGLLYVLTDIAEEMAEANANAVGNEKKAQVWKDVAKALHQAAEKAVRLIADDSDVWCQESEPSAKRNKGGKR